jgi:hypothetical protein
MRSQMALSSSANAPESNEQFVIAKANSFFTMMPVSRVSNPTLPTQDVEFMNFLALFNII